MFTQSIVAFGGPGNLRGVNFWGVRFSARPRSALREETL